jgi:hypothetical protein
MGRAMASLLSPRQLRSRLSLQATEPTEDAPEATGTGGELPAGGWLSAVGGALVIALAGWVLVAGLSVLGWLTSEPGTLGEALVVGTELWLLANGGGTQLDGLAGTHTITLVPWGFVLLIGFLVVRAAGFAARQLPRESGASVLSVAVMMTVAYLAPLMATALLLGQPLPAVRGAAVMAPVVAAAAAWGAGRAGAYRPLDRVPSWARSLPRAVLAAQLVMVATGAAALVTAAVQNLGGIERLVDALDAGLTGNLALLMLQLAFAPNLIVWAASYALGAGFSLGSAGLVAPAGTELGVLPGVPVFGALPASGAADATSFWWLAGGVLAGAVAATVIVLARPRARFDETSLVGGLAGVLSGAAFTGLAWLSSGDLGVARLVDLGPRLVPLLILACTTLGLAGVGTGLGLGLIRLVRRTVRARRAAKSVAGEPGASEPEG